MKNKTRSVFFWSWIGCDVLHMSVNHDLVSEKNHFNWKYDEQTETHIWDLQWMWQSILWSEVYSKTTACDAQENYNLSLHET